MDLAQQFPAHAGAADLARHAPFVLGGLAIDPPARRISVGPHSEMLEPRVMRVLVALGEVPGHVLSRDDLIEQCWDGQIVGDKAITRAISLLRHAIDRLARGAVHIETIAKVGFRIVVDTPAADTERTGILAFAGIQPGNALQAQAAAPRSTANWTRRAAAVALVAAGAAASIGFTGWVRTKRHVPDPRARDLFMRGQMQLKAWEIGSIRQAIAYNKQAVELDPDFADAWGALAISYVHGLDGLTGEAKAAYPGLVRSAAERALALDPDQAEAHVALAIAYPHYRRWFDHERRLRRLTRRFPNYWYGHAQLGVVMADVGRYEDAIVSYRRAREIDPMVPISWGRLAHALQQAGHDQEADLVLDEAQARWPEHVFLWVTRSSNLIEGRRFAEAAAFSRDPARRPMKMPEELWRGNADTATALATGKGAEHVIEMARAQLKQSAGISGLGWLAALGAVDLAFDALEAYYLGGVVSGTRYLPPGPLDKRPVGFGLINTFMLEHREHPRFKALLERTGLEDYWRKSGTQPDFRQNG